MNKKGDVFKSSVGKAFINKLKRVSKNENEIHVKKPVPEQKVRYKQKEKVHDRVIILSLIHISSPRDRQKSRMPSSA